jgi:ABC-type multidrug transport system permease subunit
LKKHSRTRKSSKEGYVTFRYIKEGFTTDYTHENSSMNLNIVWAVLIFLLIVALIISFKN